MSTMLRLDYLEWQALLILYRNKDRASSPLKYVGLKATVDALMHHKPALAQWVGKPANNQVRITAEGITFYQGTDLPD
jgi:hypothetical protein